MKIFCTLLLVGVVLMACAPQARDAGDDFDPYQDQDTLNTYQKTQANQFAALYNDLDTFAAALKNRIALPRNQWCLPRESLPEVSQNLSKLRQDLDSLEDKLQAASNLETYTQTLAAGHREAVNLFFEKIYIYDFADQPSSSRPNPIGCFFRGADPQKTINIGASIFSQPYTWVKADKTAPIFAALRTNQAVAYANLLISHFRTWIAVSKTLVPVQEPEKYRALIQKSVTEAEALIAVLSSTRSTLERGNEEARVAFHRATSNRIDKFNSTYFEAMLESNPPYARFQNKDEDYRKLLFLLLQTMNYSLYFLDSGNR